MFDVFRVTELSHWQKAKVFNNKVKCFEKNIPSALKKINICTPQIYNISRKCI